MGCGGTGERGAPVRALRTVSAADPIELCLAGRISPEVALARLVMAGLAPEQISQRLVGMRIAPASQQERAARAGLARLLADQRDNIARLVLMLAESELAHDSLHADADTAIAALRSSFDRAVACSPEASVAAYSLGNPTILHAATAELVDWLAAERLIRPDRDVLDLGCGIGRVAAALAPRCRSVLGLDLAPGMIAEARRRHAAPNLRFALADGRGLAHLPDASVDLVLAVDSFPYMMQAGAAVAERHVADAARLVRQGGAFAIFNLSYRNDAAADRKDAERWAADFGFRLLHNGERPFALWDGTAFVLGK